MLHTGSVHNFLHELVLKQFANQDKTPSRISWLINELINKKWILDNFNNRSIINLIALGKINWEDVCFHLLVSQKKVFPYVNLGSGSKSLID